MSCVQSVDSNWRPRSVDTVDGTPNRDTQTLMKALVTVSAVMSVSGIASGHRVNLSMHVNSLGSD